MAHSASLILPPQSPSTSNLKPRPQNPVPRLAREALRAAGHSP